ncbi:MAG: TonB-dependent receptor [Bacteroidetes bacterium]|nr:TonB-dependent receptor [Bacteroidota bacterium]
MKKLLILFLLFIYPFILFSQSEKGIITGKVLIHSNGEPLYNCNIFIEDIFRGTVSDSLGKFSFELPHNLYKIRFSYVGFETVIKEVKLNKENPGVQFIVYMKHKSYNEKEVTVTAEKNTPSTIIQNIKSKDIQKMPNMFSDPVRSVQVFSGVATNNELSSSYNVRGGSYEENLIYLNGFEIYRPFLLRSGAEENQSLINPDMVDELSFFNGAFPAGYGDKMSSALEVSYKNEHSETLNGKLRFDFLNSGITISKKQNGINFSAGIRYAYPNLFLNNLQTQGDYRPSFSDFQLLANYKIDENEKFETFFLYANNKYDLTPSEWIGHLKTDRGAEYNQITIDYEGERNYNFNTGLAGVKFLKSISGELNFNIAASLFFTDENEGTNLTGDIFYSPDANRPEENKEFVKTRYERNDNSLKFLSYNFKPELIYSFGSNKIIFGADLRLVNVKNNVDEKLFEISENSYQKFPEIKNTDHSYNINSFALYSQSKIQLLNNLSADIGLRYLYYNFTKESLISPRLSFSYYADSSQTFSFSWGYYYQPPFVNELKYRSNPESGNMKSQLAVHYVFGWEYYFKEKVNLQVEAYYKMLENIYPFYFENIKMIYLDKYSTEGYSFGFDVMFKGEIVRGIQSWLGYSYLNSQEKFTGSDMPYRRRLLDQTHTFQIYLQDRFPKHSNWQSHLKFLFGSGYLFNQRRIETNQETGQNQLVVAFDNPQEYLIYLRVDMGLSAEFEIAGNKLMFMAEVLNVFNQYNIAGYEWIQIFSDYNQPLRIPQVLSKRFFNIRAEYSF